MIRLEIDEREISAALEKDLSGAAEKLVRDLVKLSPAEMKRLINESPATGRKYRRAGGEGFRRFHVASGKGNPPRNDTGALNKSIRGRMTGRLSGEIEMLWYGAFHDERGRPFIEQAFDHALEREI